MEAFILNKTKKFILLLFSFVVITFCFASCTHNHSYGESVTTKPSCFTDGATYYICSTCGNVSYESYVKATGHILGEWENNIRFLNSSATCEVCGLTQTRSEYTAPNDIPQLFFYGEPRGVEIPIKLIYTDKNGNSQEHVGTTKYDSNSENLYYKRDYDFLVYDSEGFENTVLFDDVLGHNSRYTLKAEYIDKSYIRNLALSDVWADVVKTRKKLDSNISKLKYFGAEKGIPVLFYTNDNFKGIYTLCTPNDEILFDVKNEETQALIYTYTDFSTFDFKYQNGNLSEVPCTIIWPKDDALKDKTKENFKEFCFFVNTSDDKTFKSRITRYLDVNAAIDYLICVYAFGADENALEYCNWVTYDGLKWIPSMYNLTYTLGLDSDHNSFTPEQSCIPQIDENGSFVSGTGSYLFDRILNLYHDEIVDRYNKLRLNALSDKNVSEKLNYYSSLISAEVDKAENDEYPEKKYFSTIDSVQDIINWYTQKTDILDDCLKK